MNIAIVGCGVMGTIVKQMALKDDEIDKAWNIEPLKGDELEGDDIDVIIDFSHPDALDKIYSYVKSCNGRVAVVFATTGYSKEDEIKIKKLSCYAPVLKSSNFSYGINALRRIIFTANGLVGKYSDVEIIERHHNKKIDAPSGTAIMLSDVIDPRYERSRILGRSGECHRGNEIGIHSIRGGTIFGEHSVLFALEDEVIEIKHTAFSKNIFAKGAITAAKWLNGKDVGYYDIDEVFV